MIRVQLIKHLTHVLFAKHKHTGIFMRNWQSSELNVLKHIND